MEVFFGLDEDKGSSVGVGDVSHWDVKPGDKESLKRAFHPQNPFRPKWIAATDKERLRLECYRCWGKLSPSEERDFRKGLIKATPCALLLNKKRNSTFKARLVVLGDRWDNPESASCHASVVSQVGNRTALTVAARNKFHPVAFDIGNAFIRASIGDSSSYVVSAF